MAKSIEQLYTNVFKLRTDLENILDEAANVVTIAREFPGEIARVLVEQLNKYFSPEIRSLIDDDKKPGSMIGIIRFLDSVPLAMTREAPAPEPVQPIFPENPAIVTPEGTTATPTEVDQLPQNISYAKPQGEVQQVQESVRYQVVRKLDIPSALGDKFKSKNKDVVAEFINRQDAEKRARALDETVTPGEKEAFGTRYEVVEKEFKELV